MEPIAIITTGGTIDKVYFDAKGGYEVGVPMVRHMLGTAQALENIEILEVMRKDSLQMTAADRTMIADAVKNHRSARVVVTHGTDTMVDTAHTLQGIVGKTIVLTGSLQPARFTESDAPFNLGMAIAAVQTLPHGVYVVANGQVFNADSVRKNRERNRFEQTAPHRG